MSGPPTILIREKDEDRTLIDPIRLSDPDPPFEGSGRVLSSADPSLCLDALPEKPQRPWHRVRAKLSGRGRRAMEAGVLIAMVLSLGSLAYHQWRASNALRRLIAEMNAERSAIHLQDAVGSPGLELTRLGTEPRPAASSRDVTSANREEGENRGASLIGSNDFEGALTHYQKLAQLFPNEAAFRDVVIVLKGRLRCASPAAAVSAVCP